MDPMDTKEKKNFFFFLSFTFIYYLDKLYKLQNNLIIILHFIKYIFI